MHVTQQAVLDKMREATLMFFRHWLLLINDSTDL